MTNRTRKWIRAGLETLIHGGASSLVSTITAAQLDSVNFGWFTPNFWRMAGAAFTVNGLLRFFQWWGNNPLPPEGDTKPPFADLPQISMNPMSKVVPAPPKE